MSKNTEISLHVHVYVIFMKYFCYHKMRFMDLFFYTVKYIRQFEGSQTFFYKTFQSDSLKIFLQKYAIGRSLSFMPFLNIFNFLCVRQTKLYIANKKIVNHDP